MTTAVSKLITENLDIWASAVKTKSSAGRGSSKNIELYGIKKLRELILELAVRGLLEPQDKSDEPASVLLERIAKDKTALINAGTVKKQKAVPDVESSEQLFSPPPQWVWCRLDHLALNAEAGWSPKCEGGPRAGDDWGVLKVSAVTWGEFRPEENKSLPQNLQPRDHLEVKPGDFLISRANTAELVARAVVVPSGAPAKLMMSDKIIRFEISPLTSASFLNLVNGANLSRNYYARVAGGTSSSMKNVSRLQIRALALPLPPLTEQHRIVAKVDELMALCDQLEQQQESSLTAHQTLVQTLLAALTTATEREGFEAAWARIDEHFHQLFTTENSIEQLKKTLLQLAVMGKLVPQDPNDEPASVLLEKIEQEKANLIEAGAIKRQKLPIPVDEAEMLYALPKSWVWQRVSNIAYVGTGATPSRADSSFYSPADFDWVTSGETGNELIHETKEKVSRKAVEQTNVSIYPVGTLIVAMYGQGKTRGQITELMVEAGTNQACAAIQLHETSSVHRSFIKRYFQKAYEELRSHSAGGAQPNLNVAKISATLVPLAPLKEQQRIVAKVDQLMALCDQLKTQLKTSQTTQLQLADTLAEQAVAA